MIYSAGSVTPLGYSLICLFTCTNSLAQGVYTAIPVLHTHVCFVLVSLEDSASAGLNWLSVCLYCVCLISNAPYKVQCLVVYLDIRMTGSSLSWFNTVGTTRTLGAGLLRSDRAGRGILTLLSYPGYNSDTVEIMDDCKDLQMLRTSEPLLYMEN